MLRQEFLEKIVKSLKVLIDGAHGKVITFTTEKLGKIYIKYFNNREKLQSLSAQFRKVLEKLEDANLVRLVRRTARGKVYQLTRQDLLFTIVKESETVETAVEKIRKIYNEKASQKHRYKNNNNVSLLN